jgi:hypothetical protein
MVTSGKPSLPPVVPSTKKSPWTAFSEESVPPKLAELSNEYPLTIDATDRDVVIETIPGNGVGANVRAIAKEQRGKKNKNVVAVEGVLPGIDAHLVSSFTI